MFRIGRRRGRRWEKSGKFHQLFPGSTVFMNKNADQDLIEAVKKGDHKAFEALVQQYEKPIFNVVYRMLHNTEESRDVTQTVFLKTFENLHRYQPERKFFSWICRIAVNEAINRQARYRPETEFTDSTASGGENPGDAVQRDELHQGLENALMQLGTDYRSVVVLKHIVGMSYHEIGETLEVSEKTVKSRLYSARQKMRDQLRKEEYL
jgi:RNA polymerase sigma-70 factor (ECF subfamily)